MYLGREVRQFKAVDDATVKAVRPTVKAQEMVAPVAAAPVPAPVVVNRQEDWMLLGKLQERQGALEAVVAQQKETESNSVFFGDFVPAEWEKETEKADA